MNQAWFDARIASKTEAHLFVYGHEPAFGVNHNDNLALYPRERDLFWNALGKGGGRVYFCGHDHLYNRADLLDDAYKREGRSDDSIPFLMPEPSEYEDIFKVMITRYGISTDITDFSAFARAVAEKIYCTGASVEWTVREADMYAGRDGKDKVEAAHSQQAIDDWEMKLNPAEVDRQTVLAIEGSSKRLRPGNWEAILTGARERLRGRQAFPRESSVFPGLTARAPITQ